MMLFLLYLAYFSSFTFLRIFLYFSHSLPQFSSLCMNILKTADPLKLLCSLPRIIFIICTIQEGQPKGQQNTKEVMVVLRQSFARCHLILSFFNVKFIFTKVTHAQNIKSKQFWKSYHEINKIQIILFCLTLFLSPSIIPQKQLHSTLVPDFPGIYLYASEQYVHLPFSHLSRLDIIYWLPTLEYENLHSHHIYICIHLCFSSILP